MDAFMMKWHTYTNEDNLEGNDRIYNKFLDIYVLDPRTTIKKGRAEYTDYAIQVKTNHPEFAIKDSCVRRRYSDFVWLENRLSINDVMMTVAPSLPGKRYFGRFKCQFLQKRQLGLQSFLNKVVEITPFLYEPALHLFLQTSMSTSHMEKFLQHGVHLSNVRDRIIALHNYKENKEKEKERSLLQCKSCSEVNMKRTFSLDSFTTSMSKVEDSNDDSRQESGGRGWSRFIGEQPWCIKTDSDVTDFAIDCGVTTFRRHSAYAAPTACVLPGGRLRLADDDVMDQQPSNNTTESTLITSTNLNSNSFTRNICKQKKRSNSWHGHNSDVVDLLLDNYDVVDIQPADAIVSSLNSDTTTISNTSENKKDTSRDGSGGVWKLASNDKTEIKRRPVDINERLTEYDIVTAPLPTSTASSHHSLERLCHTFHHSISCGSDSSLSDS